MADNETKEIGFVEKNSRGRYYVTQTEWRGNEYCDMREYYLDDEDEWRPTKKGVRLNVELIPDLIEVLKKISQ